MVRVLMASVVLLSACADAGDGAVVAATEPQVIVTDIASELLAPLEGLGPCGDPPTAPASVPEVPGLHLPDGAVVTGVTPQGPVTQVDGWVPLTPIGVRADYVHRDDLEVLTVEDEVWESETLVTDGTHRLFVKAQGVCRTASVFVAIVSPEAPGEG